MRHVLLKMQELEREVQSEIEKLVAEDEDKNQAVIEAKEMESRRLFQLIDLFFNRAKL